MKCYHIHFHGDENKKKKKEGPLDDEMIDQVFSKRALNFFFLLCDDFCLDRGTEREEKREVETRRMDAGASWTKAPCLREMASLETWHKRLLVSICLQLRAGFIGHVDWDWRLWACKRRNIL
jgi:hypothetical protein